MKILLHHENINKDDSYPLWESRLESAPDGGSDPTAAAEKASCVGSAKALRFVVNETGTASYKIDARPVGKLADR